ncbi:cation:proton antiporter [Lentilactobacillus senioris]|uniref:cation:proton antiporter n=1 Tax=Lentilactobacillus senioris TaxID=931534 RepID=UPI000A76C1C4|nr:cation:proton antiporter [Lentilactobacillus senioris]
MNYIGEIALILFTTLLAGAISQRFKMPMVIGELLIGGVILGPGVLHLISDGELMTAGSEIGVIILMFLAGIESDLTQLKKYFRPALLVAGLGVILPMVVFYYLGMLNHQGFERSIFWGRNFFRYFGFH